MRYDRYGKGDRIGARTKRPERVRLERGGAAMKPRRRGLVGVTHASR